MCRETSLSYLNDLGYNLVRLPREGIDPLLLLGRVNNHLEVLGSVPELFQEDPVPPPITKNQATAKISGKQTDKFELSLGLKILKDLLSAFGLGGIDLGFAYKRASRIQFTYGDVLADSVSLIRFAEYLRTARLSSDNPILLKMNEEGEAYGITETLKSNSFGTVAYDENDIAMKLDVTGLKNALEAHAAIDVSEEANLKVSYKGQKHLPFAFKAAVIWFEIVGGRVVWRLHPRRDIGIMAMPTALAAPDEPTTVLLGRNTVLRVKW